MVGYTRDVSSLSSSAVFPPAAFTPPLLLPAVATSGVVETESVCRRHSEQFGFVSRLVKLKMPCPNPPILTGTRTTLTAESESM